MGDSGSQWRCLGKWMAEGLRARFWLERYGVEVPKAVTNGNRTDAERHCMERNEGGGGGGGEAYRNSLSWR